MKNCIWEEKIKEILAAVNSAAPIPIQDSNLEELLKSWIPSEYYKFVSYKTNGVDLEVIACQNGIRYSLYRFFVIGRGKQPWQVSVDLQLVNAKEIIIHLTESIEM